MSPQAGRLFSGEDLAVPEPVSLAGSVAWVYTHGGPQREPGANQDAVAVFPIREDRGLLVVADGVGGSASGARAAALTLTTLWDTTIAADPDGANLRSAVLDGIELANQRIREVVGGASTLVVAEIDGHTVRPYHVGDSALWVVGQRGRVKIQTVEHSPVGYAVEAGLLDAGEALHHEHRHIISNAVGTDDMRIEVGSPLALAARDTLLLGSDGLFDNLHGAEIVDMIRRGPLERAAHALVEAARSRMEQPSRDDPSKPDDLSFILYRR